MARDKTKRGKATGQTADEQDLSTGQLQRIALEKLRFDPENPRVVEQLGERSSQTDIEKLLLDGPMNARELIPSFVTNGFIPYEPLIVKPEGSHFIVVEGN